MNKTCPVCEANFEPEPGFYYGAMFVSYAITVAIMVVVGAVLYVAFRPLEWVYLTSIAVAVVLLSPFSFRYSRVLFLYWFGGYRHRPEEHD